MNALHPEPQYPGVEKAATILISKVSVGHMGLIKVASGPLYSTFEFQSTYEIILFEAVQIHQNQWNFLLLHIDLTFIQDALGSYFESNPPFSFLLSFLSFHSYPFSSPYSLKFHYFFIQFSDPWMPFVLHNMEQNGVKRNKQFLIFKASTFSLSHMEIFCPTVCKHRRAPFLRGSLSSIVLGTLWCWAD